MKHLSAILIGLFLLSSCNNGSSNKNVISDSTTTKQDTTHLPATSNLQNSGSQDVDTNGHILENGKVRSGNDKIMSGDLKMSDSSK